MINRAIQIYRLHMATVVARLHTANRDVLRAIKEINIHIYQTWFSSSEYITQIYNIQDPLIFNNNQFESTARISTFPEQATTEQPSHICCHWQGQSPFSDRIAPHHNETHLQWVKCQLHTRSLPPLCILPGNVVACQECHFHPKYSHLGVADVCM